MSTFLLVVMNRLFYAKKCIRARIHGGMPHGLHTGRRDECVMRGSWKKSVRRNRALFGRLVTCELSHTPPWRTFMHIREHARIHAWCTRCTGRGANVRMHILKARATCACEKKHQVYTRWETENSVESQRVSSLLSRHTLSLALLVSTSFNPYTGNENSRQAVNYFQQDPYLLGLTFELVPHSSYRFVSWTPQNKTFRSFLFLKKWIVCSWNVGNKPKNAPSTRFFTQKSRISISVFSSRSFIFRILNEIYARNLTKFSNSARRGEPGNDCAKKRKLLIKFFVEQFSSRWRIV